MNGLKWYFKHGVQHVCFQKANIKSYSLTIFCSRSQSKSVPFCFVRLRYYLFLVMVHILHLPGLWNVQNQLSITISKEWNSIFSRSFILREIDFKFVCIWKNGRQKQLVNVVWLQMLFIWLLKRKMMFQEFIRDHMAKQCYWSMEKDILITRFNSNGCSLATSENDLLNLWLV